MLITRETDYALRILRTVAQSEQLTVGEICERELVPQQFAYKILQKLASAGLVQMARGARGGCRLLGDLHATSLYDLMNAMDADARVISCAEPGYTCNLQKNTSNCLIHVHLLSIQHALDEELARHSLYDILFGDG